MPQEPRVEVRLLNLCKRLRTLADIERSYSLKAVAEEIEIGVKELLRKQP